MGFLSTLFGGGKSKSSNQAYGDLSPVLLPGAQAGVGAIQSLGNELGGGFEQYKKNAGFDFAMGEGLKGITGAGAAKGLLRAGSTSKALERFRMGLAGREYGNYLNQLGQLGGLGVGAAGALSNAGQQSSSKEQNGILTSLFSDPAVKRDIRKVGEFENGLGLYLFRYRTGHHAPLQLGVMADEVKKVFPEAVSTATWIDGSERMVVDYDMLFPQEDTEKEAG